MLILKQNEDIDKFAGSGFYNSNDICKPISFILRGTYVDYGLAKLDENEFASNFLLSYVLSETGISMSNLDEVLVLIDREETNLSYMMIHEQLLDNLLESVSNRIVYKSELTFREMLSKLLNNYKETFNEDSYIYRYLYHINYSVFPKLLNKAIKENFAVDKDFIDLIILDRLFQFSRLFYFPQLGVGSQTDEMQVHLDISYFIINRTKDFIEKNYSAEDGFVNSVLETTIFLPVEEELEKTEDIDEITVNESDNQYNEEFEETQEDMIGNIVDVDVDELEIVNESLSSSI